MKNIEIKERQQGHYHFVVMPKVFDQRGEIAHCAK
jgi:hypothetical protein